MARAINNKEEYGHDAMFVDEVLEEHKCVVCHLVLKDALQIMTCGHRFCSPCFNRMKTHAQQTNIDLVCPVDREVVVLGKVFEDRGIARSIGNLKTRCENLNQGCVWVGELRDLHKHQGECAHQIMVQMNRTSLEAGDHDNQMLLSEILIRLQKCEDDLIAKERRLEMCENDLMIKEKDIAHCKITLEEMKDDAKVREQDIKLLKISNLQLQNEINAFAENNDLVTKKVDLGWESSNKTQDELKVKINALAEELAKLNHSLSADKKRDDHEALDNKDVSKKLESCQTEIRKINKKVIALEELKNNTDDHLANLENISFSRRSFFNNDKQDIKFQWVMTNFNENFTAGHKVSSPLFHTGVQGYRIRFYVEWTGPRKGSLGLYLSIYRDEAYIGYRGPFNREYTLEIMDRHGVRKALKVESDDIQEYPSCFTIQNGEEKSEDGFGFDNMLTAPFDRFVINNALFISCTIHM